MPRADQLPAVFQSNPIAQAGLADTYIVPATAVAASGHDAIDRFLNFFGTQIPNANTRAAYLLAAPQAWPRRLIHLAATGAVALVVGFSWFAAYDLVPPDQRPYAGSTTDNSMLQMVFVQYGIDRFILSGYPHLEECYRFAELVFPKLPLKDTTGNDLGPAKNAGPFGEVIANVIAPSQRKAAAG